jgi:hypothetical protein
MRALILSLLGSFLLLGAAGAQESALPDRATERFLAGIEAAGSADSLAQAEEPAEPIELATPAQTMRASCTEGATISIWEGCCGARYKLYEVSQCRNGVWVFLRNDCVWIPNTCFPR